jgi:hypothetical protein
MSCPDDEAPFNVSEMSGSDMSSVSSTFSSCFGCVAEGSGEPLNGRFRGDLRIFLAAVQSKTEGIASGFRRARLT